MMSDDETYEMLQAIRSTHLDLMVHRNRTCIILQFHTMYGLMPFVLPRETALALAEHVQRHLNADPPAMPLTPLELTIKEMLGSDDAHE